MKPRQAERADALLAYARVAARLADARTAEELAAAGRDLAAYYRAQQRHPRSRRAARLDAISRASALQVLLRDAVFELRNGGDAVPARMGMAGAPGDAPDRRHGADAAWRAEAGRAEIG